MRHTRVALAVTAVLGLALAGCGERTAGAPARPADPKAALTAATAGLRAGDYSFVASLPAAKSAGSVHLPSHSAAITVESRGGDTAGTFEFRAVGADNYVRMNVDTTQMMQGFAKLNPADPDQKKLIDGAKQLTDLFSGKNWLHVDPAKAKGSSNLTVDLSDPDLTGAIAMLAGVVTATGDGRVITGTLDASKLGAADGPLDAAQLKALGDKAKTLPYRATLDDQGRLGELTVDLPATADQKAGRLSVAVSGYGGAQPQQKPPANEIKELPDSAYSLLNG